jgi:hypothetical protein
VSKRDVAVLKPRGDEGYATRYPVARQPRRDGKTLAEILAILNSEGYTTSRGLPWGKVQVARLLERADRLAVVVRAQENGPQEAGDRWRFTSSGPGVPTLPCRTAQRWRHAG